MGPEPGSRHTLAGDTETYGIKPDVVVTVRETVAADTIGAHDDTADAVVVTFLEPTVVYDDHGQPTLGQVERAVAVTVPQFDTLFQPAEDS